MRLTTAELPGTGGLFKSTPDDFVVEELPAYAPTGTGGHTFCFIEKRALITDEVFASLCRALGVRRDDAGAAGKKDRQALTRQWRWPGSGQAAPSTRPWWRCSAPILAASWL